MYPTDLQQQFSNNIKINNWFFLHNDDDELFFLSWVELLEMFLTKLSWLSEVSFNWNITDTLTGQKLLREHISEKGPVRSIQLPQPYTQSTRDNSAPDAHFNSSFPKSP